MNELPDYEPRQVPEGHYDFELKKPPEKRRRGEGEKSFISVMFVFRVTGGDMENERQHTESFVPWDERYGQILAALGGKKDASGKCHLSDSVDDIVGRGFEADIVHEPDKDDPKKKWARIANIKSLDDDVPF